MPKPHLATMQTVQTTLLQAITKHTENISARTLGGCSDMAVPTPNAYTTSNSIKYANFEPLKQSCS
jgi:hypothetical protein